MTADRDSAAGADAAARSASERVRAIVEASEASAGSRQRKRPVDQSADDPRASDPRAESESELAGGDIRALVEQLSASTAAILTRIDVLQSELRELRELARSSLEPATAPAAPELGERVPTGSATAGQVSEAPGGRSSDADGARLIALNMALNGTPREETDHYLADHYALEDRERLLDAVYAQLDV